MEVLKETPTLVEVRKLTSLEAAELRLLAIECQARIQWLKGGCDVRVTLKTPKATEKFLKGMSSVGCNYQK